MMGGLVPLPLPYLNEQLLSQMPDCFASEVQINSSLLNTECAHVGIPLIQALSDFASRQDASCPNVHKQRTLPTCTVTSLSCPDSFHQQTSAPLC